jgi:hypothetical protein
MLKNKENFLSFQFSVFLDDHACELKSKRRMSESLSKEEFPYNKEYSPILKRERTCSIETKKSKSNSFSIADFYPRFERFTSNEELFSFTSKNSFSGDFYLLEENSSVEEIIKKKFYNRIHEIVLDVLKLKTSFN